MTRQMVTTMYNNRPNWTLLSPITIMKALKMYFDQRCYMTVASFEALFLFRF